MSTVPCTNPAHGVQSHITGSAAALECARGTGTSGVRGSVALSVPSASTVNRRRVEEIIPQKILSTPESDNGGPNGIGNKINRDQLIELLARTGADYDDSDDEGGVWVTNAATDDEGYPVDFELEFDEKGEITAAPRVYDEYIYALIAKMREEARKDGKIPSTVPSAKAEVYTGADLYDRLVANGHNVGIWKDDPWALRSYAQAIQFSDSGLSPENQEHLAELESGRSATVKIGRVGDSDIIALVNEAKSRGMFANVDTAAVTSLRLTNGREVGATDVGGSVRYTLNDGSTIRSDWALDYLNDTDTEESAVNDLSREEIEALIAAADYVAENSFSGNLGDGDPATEIMKRLQAFQQ